jgi:putative membrane protein
MIDYATTSWVRIVTSVRGTVLPRIFTRTAICVAIALVAAYCKAERGIDLTIPAMIHTLLGVALGLLLVFRTNTSYDRYWEGRKLLGCMVNRTRDLARQSAVYLKNDEARERAGGYIIALYVCIRHYLRHERRWDELADHLNSDEMAELGRRRAAPLLVSRWLTELVAKQADDGTITPIQQRLMDTNITAMIDLWGGAERILKTPVPFAYAHHIKVFLTLFCFTVPFALLNAMTWFAVAGAAVVAFGMFGIDEIGVEIEDPFGYDPNDLPLDTIGETIAVDVTETVARDAVVGTTYES